MSILDHNCHDDGLIDYSVGPRRELRLRLWVDGTHESVVRFGAVQNIEAVRDFLGGLSRPSFEGAFLDQVDSLHAVEGGWLLQLDHGGEVRIETLKEPTVQSGEAG